MAWILAVVATPFALTYIGDKITDTYNEYTKPLYKASDDLDKYYEEKEIERRRQIQIERTRIRHEKNDKIREQYNIKKSHYCINNTDNVCNIIYVSKYYATNEQEAIYHAKQTLSKGLFSFNLTKYETIGVDCRIDILQCVMKEYFIVINSNDKFVVLNENEKEIRLKNKFGIQNEEFSKCF